MITLTEARRATPEGRRLGRRIAELRKRHGLTQEELASQAHMSLGYPPSIEAGRRIPSAGVLKAIAAVLRTPYAELAALAGYGPEEGAPDPPRLLRDEITSLLGAIPYEVPVYDDLPIHAGRTGTPLQITYLPPTQRKPGSLVGLLVRGDCMAPSIEEGEVVIVDLEAAPEDGDVVAIETEDGWALRRYHLSNSSYELSCDNPDAREEGHRGLVEGAMYPVIDVRKGRPRRPRRR